MDGVFHYLHEFLKDTGIRMRVKYVSCIYWYFLFMGWSVFMWLISIYIKVDYLL